MMVRNSALLSSMRFYGDERTRWWVGCPCLPLPACKCLLVLTSLSDSTRTWSYSLRATKNMMDVTFSKQWIHFLRSDLCPPTSTILGRRQATQRAAVACSSAPFPRSTWPQAQGNQADVPVDAQVQMVQGLPRAWVALQT